MSSRIEKTSITVPGDWRNSLSSGASSSFGYGTYRLRILLDDEENESYRMYFSRIQTAATVYINGKVVSEMGQPSKNEAHSIPKNSPFSVLVEKGVTEIDLVIHVSNFEDPHSGGIVKSIRLGTDETIIKEQALSYSFQFMVAIVLFFHGIYAGLFLFFFLEEKKILYLALAFFCMSIATIADNDKILLYLFPIIII